MSTQTTTETFAEIGIPINPFPGLRPFEFDESHLFFGRDGQSEQLIGKLGRTHFLAVVGTSGSGKSSLVRAGFLPALYGGFMTSAGSNWRVAIMRPGNDPIGNLARALNAPDVFGSDIVENAAIQTAMAEATLRRGSLGLVDAIRQAVMPEDENLLVVVDQFEEIFRFARVAEGEAYGNEAAGFVKLLLEAAGQRDIPIYVVLTMRSDYLGDCSQFWELPEAINESQYLIPRLTRDQLREAITGPVAVGGGQITPRLVNRLLNDVGDNQDQLPVLQHLLMRVWDESKERQLMVEVNDGAQTVTKPHREVHEGDAMDLCCSAAVGGMTEALSRHADEAFNELPDDRHREVSEKLFKALTEKGSDNREIRRPITLSEICAVANAGKDEVITVIDTFRQPGRSFLMPPANVALNSQSLVDISHESLIRGWARLKSWVDEEARSARIYRRLADTAELHREGNAGLWGDPDLQLALDWQENSKPNPNWAQRYYPHFETAIAFLQASEKKRDDDVAARERQQQEEIQRAKRELEQAHALAEAQQQRAEAERQKAEEQQQRLEQQARASSRLRGLLGILVVVVLLALASAVVAFGAYRNANAAKAEANIQRTNAIAERENAVIQRTNAIAERENAVKLKDEADRQAKIAVAAKKDAEEKSGIALKETENAKTAAREAETQKQIAETQKIKANEASERFVSAGLNGEALRALQAGDSKAAADKFTAFLDRCEKIKDSSCRPYALENIADIYYGRVPFVLAEINFSEDPAPDEEGGLIAAYGAIAKQYAQLLALGSSPEDINDEKALFKKVSIDGEQAIAYYKQALDANKGNLKSEQAFREAGILKNLGDLQIFLAAANSQAGEGTDEKGAARESKPGVESGIQLYLASRAAYVKAQRPLEEAGVLIRAANLLGERALKAPKLKASDQVKSEAAAQAERAAKFFEEGADAFHRAKRPLKEGSALERIGELYTNLIPEPEELIKAIPYFERALKIFRDEKSFKNQGDLINKLVGLYDSDERKKIALYKEGFEAYRRAATLKPTRDEESLRKSAEMLKGAGELLSKSGRKDEAHKFFEAAITDGGKDAESQAWILTTIGEFYKQNDVAEALKYYGRKRDTWRQAKNPLEEGNTLFEIGLIQNGSGNITGAIEAFDVARQVYKQIDAHAVDDTGKSLRSVLAEKLKTMAGIYAGQDKQKAIASYEEALQSEMLVQKLSSNYSLLQILQAEGRILLEMKTNEANTRAERLFQNVIEFSRSPKIRDGEASTLSSIGDLYKTVGQAAEARAYYERVRLISVAARNTTGLVEALGKISELVAKGSPAKPALDYYLGEAEAASRAHDSFTQGIALEMAAGLYRYTDKPKAIDYFEQARLAFQRGGLKAQELSVTRTLAYVYSETGNKPKSQELEKRVAELSSTPD